MSEIRQAYPNEFTATDPITGGTWRVLSPTKMSDVGGMLAIAQTLLEQDIRPKKGSTLTVLFELKVEGQ